MKNSKVKAILMSGLMAASMMIAPMSAMAASDNEPTATKTVKVADGVTIPDNVTFTVAQDTNEDGTTSPSATALSWTVDAETKGGTSKTGSFSAEATSLDIASHLAKTGDALTAGEYTFKVTETTPTKATGDYGWIATDSTEYYVHVFVTNTGDVNYRVSKTDKTTKVSDIKFENTYTATATLKVSKTVEHPEYANADTKYKFHITFTKAEPNTGSVTIGTGDTATTVAYGKAYDFTLEDNKSLTFNVPAGTTYTLTEDNATNVQSTTFTVNGSKVSEVTNVLVKEGNENTAAVTNTYKDIAPTGVVTSIAPFIALIAIAAIAIAVYTSMKKRMTR